MGKNHVSAHSNSSKEYMDERKLWFKHHQRLLLLHSVHYVYSLNDVMWRGAARRGAARRGVNGMHNLFLVKSK